MARKGQVEFAGTSPEKLKFSKAEKRSVRYLSGMLRCAEQRTHKVAAYSVRNAAIGLISVARRAGSQVASNAATANTNGAMVKASGSSAPTS